MLSNFQKEKNIYSLQKFHAWLVFNFMIHFHKNLDFYKSALQDTLPSLVRMGASNQHTLYI